jgi:hypothetical protein
MHVGTVIWSLPDGQTYVTTPGSAMLFPVLCASTAGLPPVVPAARDRCGERDVMMPKRARTREQNRAARIAAERQHNRATREARRKHWEEAYLALLTASDDDEPPPF